jgi:predicted nucleic acid-binding protein
MIILDTNVISELMRDNPAAIVKQWISQQKAVHLSLTTITIAEIQRGLMRLPTGKRRTNLEVNFNRFLTAAFAGRVFSFDQQAADLYGQISAEREHAGFHVDAVNLMIASIAKNENAKIATRNIKDFIGCGIELINPWESTDKH